MNFFKCSLKAIALLPVIILLASALQAQELPDDQYNINELMEKAGEAFDLSDHEAVLLLDKKYIRLFHDATYTRYFHHIILINSESAAEKYGTTAVVFDKAHCRFGLRKAGAWKDGQWYNTEPGDLKEKIPDALINAEDYNTIHEIIIPYKSLKPPFIIEVSYAIEDRGPFQKGEEGLWLFARKLPVLQSEFSFELPAGSLPNLYGPTSVPEPVLTTDEEYGLDKYTWTMGPLKAIPQPYNPDPAKEVPYITWSTWKDWKTFGENLSGFFTEAMRLDDKMKSVVNSLTRYSRTDKNKALAIAQYIQDNIRYIDYPSEFWLQFPRPALLTYASGYAHRLDKAVLAATLFQQAGLKPRFIYIGRGYGDIHRGVPLVARMNDISVWILGENLSVCYNPETGNISGRNDVVYNRLIWLPGHTDNPSVRMASVKEPSRFDIHIELAYDENREVISGWGYFSADKIFNPHDDMAGLESESRDYLEKFVSNLISGARLVEFNPGEFSRSAVKVGLGFVLDKSGIKNGEQINIIINEPYGGILDNLPENIELKRSARASNAYLPCKMIQKIELAINMDNLEIIYHPDNDSLDNSAGYFAIGTVGNNNRLIFTKTLDIKDTIYPPEEWPSLRDLLRAETDENNGKISLRVKTD